MVSNFLFLITFVSQIIFASPVGGIQATHFILEPNHGKRIILVLKQKEISVINAAGDSKGDIDCYLYDNQGNEIAADVYPTDTCSLTVSPKWTGPYVLVVANHGKETDNVAILVQ